MKVALKTDSCFKWLKYWACVLVPPVKSFCFNYFYNFLSRNGRNSSFVPFQTIFPSNIQLSVMKDSRQGQIQEFIHRSWALRLLNPFTTLRLIIFPPPEPYTSPSSYRNVEPFKSNIEMHLSIKLYKPFLCLLVRQKHVGVYPPPRGGQSSPWVRPCKEWLAN